MTTTTMTPSEVKQAILATRINDSLEELTIGDWFEQSAIDAEELDLEDTLDFFGLTNEHIVGDLLEALDEEIKNW